MYPETGRSPNGKVYNLIYGRASGKFENTFLVPKTFFKTKILFFIIKYIFKHVNVSNTKKMFLNTTILFNMKIFFSNL